MPNKISTATLSGPADKLKVVENYIAVMRREAYEAKGDSQTAQLIYTPVSVQRNANGTLTVSGDYAGMRRFFKQQGVEVISDTDSKEEQSHTY